MTSLGFIGLGIMGKPMAGRLQKEWHDLHVFDVRHEPMAELARLGAVRCASPREVAERSGMVFLALPDTAQVEAVLSGETGLEAGLSARKIVVDMGTTSPAATRRLAARLAARGVEWVDAPISGGQVGAENGTLSFMVGARETTFHMLRPYLELMGRTVTRIGEVGTGQTAKVANQIVLAGTIAAVSEALVFAAKAGADPGRVRTALLGGFAHSRVLELHAERMLRRSFAPGAPAHRIQQDLSYAVSEARELGLSLPNTARIAQLYNALAAAGDAELDQSALVTALERMAAHRLA